MERSTLFPRRFHADACDVSLQSARKLFFCVYRFIPISISQKRVKINGVSSAASNGARGRALKLQLIKMANLDNLDNFLE